MELSYLLYSRPDLSYCVASLQKKTSSPSILEWFQLNKIFQYINSTKHLCTKIKPSCLNELIGYSDANFNNLTDDGKSFSGVCLSLGPINDNSNGLIYCKSSTQKVVSLSSTESELEAMILISKHIEWVKNFMLEVGYKLTPTILFCDNKSSIKLATNAAGSFSRTKHIMLRFHYLRDLVEKKILVLKHLSTNELLSDFLTKPLIGKNFRKFRNLILNTQN
jgi:hypothetical protein